MKDQAEAELHRLQEQVAVAFRAAVAAAQPEAPATFAAGPQTIGEADQRPRREARYALTREGTGLPPAARDLAADLALSLAAVDEIRTGATVDMSEETICEYLGAVRRAAAALAATQDELILIAREPDSAGDRVTYATLGDAMDGTHLTTVRERHGRLLDGRTHAWRPWLVQGTERAGLYGKGVARKAGEPLPLGACPACGSFNVARSILDGPDANLPHICQDCGEPVPLSKAEEELLRGDDTDADGPEYVAPTYWELLECGDTVFRQYPPMGSHGRCTEAPGEHSGLQEIRQHGVAIPGHNEGEQVSGETFPFAGGTGQVSHFTENGGYWWWIGTGENGETSESHDDAEFVSEQDALLGLCNYLRAHRKG